MGYKQELKRNFSTLEIFGIAFSIMGLLPSIASTLSFSLPAGPAGMVWSWFLASGCIFVVGLAMADLGSAMPTTGGLYYWTHYFASPRTRNYLCFLVGYSNSLGLIGGLCSIDYGFALMFCSVIVISTDGAWTPSNGIVYVVFLVCVVSHGVLASTLSRIMGKLQSFAVFMNLALILATIIALPVGKGLNRNDGHFIFADVQNLTTWPTGWTFMLAWLSAIWTIGAFDSCVCPVCLPAAPLSDCLADASPYSQGAHVRRGRKCCQGCPTGYLVIDWQVLVSWLHHRHRVSRVYRPQRGKCAGERLWPAGMTSEFSPTALRASRVDMTLSDGSDLL